MGGLVTQLLEPLDYWMATLDAGPGVDAIYLDFQKALDSVSRQRLLININSYGINGNIFKWIEAFLTDHQQKVKVNGAESDWDSGIHKAVCWG